MYAVTAIVVYGTELAPRSPAPQKAEEFLDYLPAALTVLAVVVPESPVRFGWPLLAVFSLVSILAVAVALRDSRRSPNPGSQTQNEQAASKPHRVV